MPKKSKKQPPARKPRLVVEVAPRRKARYETAADLEELHVSEWARRVLDEAADAVLKKHSESGE